MQWGFPNSPTTFFQKSHNSRFVVCCIFQCDFTAVLKIAPFFNRYDSGCAQEDYRRSHCLCGLWRTAPALMSSADCGTQPANQNLRRAGSSSYSLFTAWQTGTTNTHF